MAREPYAYSLHVSTALARSAVIIDPPVTFLTPSPTLRLLLESLSHSVNLHL